MDAIKFIKESNRMCKSFSDNCAECPANSGFCKISHSYECSAEEKLSIVEKWSNEHPAKTRQSEFLKQYPEARIRSNGALNICPAIISTTYRADDGGCLNSSKGCDDCCREFWMQEVE